MKKLIPIMFLLAIFTIGCNTYVPFTQELRQELRENYNVSNDDLINLQYYISGPLTLQRELSSEEATVTSNHVVRIIKDRRIEEIKVNRHTPGIALDVSNFSLDISFEEDAYLTFGCKSLSDPKKNSGSYNLYAEEWKNHRGKLTYAGKTFYAVYNSGSVYLLVDLREINKFKIATRTLKGRRLSEE